MKGRVMQKLLRGLTAGALLSLLAVPASADGYDRGPAIGRALPYSWAGVYVGVNGGYAWQDNSDVNLFTNAFAGGGTVALRTPGFEASGGFGGGQLGFNVQSGRVVYGLEVDFQGADIRDSFSIPSGGGPFFVGGNTFTGHSRLDWFGTVRGRLGYSFDRTLVYATGGLAYGQVNERVQGFSPTVFYDIKSDDTRVGYVIGGGLEHALAAGWTLKGEYQFIDLGSDRLTGTNTAAFAARSNEVDHQYHTFRLGLNYRFQADSYGPLK